MPGITPFAFADEIPNDPKELAVFLKRILQELRAAQDALNAALNTVHHSAPKKPREGMLRFADGTDWNPGSGAGYYEYRDAAWRKL